MLKTHFIRIFVFIIIIILNKYIKINAERYIPKIRDTSSIAHFINATLTPTLTNFNIDKSL